MKHYVSTTYQACYQIKRHACPRLRIPDRSTTGPPVEILIYFFVKSRTTFFMERCIKRYTRTVLGKLEMKSEPLSSRQISCPGKMVKNCVLIEYFYACGNKVVRLLGIKLGLFVFKKSEHLTRVRPAPNYPELVEVRYFHLGTE